MTQISAPPSHVLEAIEDGTARITRRLEIYERDMVTPWNPGGDPYGELVPRMLAGGSVSLDANREERRTLDCALDNHDNLLYPDPYTGLWYDKVFKIYKGVKLSNGTQWECQVGEFHLDGLDFESFPSTVAIVGRDPSKKMMNSKISQTETFDSSYKLGDLVKYVAINSGILATKIDVPPDTPELGKNLTFERGTPRWQIASDASKGKNYQVYFDNTGTLVLEKRADPAKSAPAFRFKSGPDGNLTGVKRSSNDSELYNVVIVESEGQAGAVPFYGIARNEEPSSPTSVQRIGERVMPTLKYASIASDKEARELARTWLAISALEPYNLNFGSISYPWIEVGYVARIDEPKALTGAPNRYLLDTANLQLGPGPMELTAKRIHLVGDPNNKGEE